MKKSDKKTDNAIRQVLTEVCDRAKVEFQGFEWLTHLVNYNNFPASLVVVCVFDSDDNLANADTQKLCSLIQNKLASVNIKLKNVQKQVHFDTEQKCDTEHNGNWNKRLS